MGIRSRPWFIALALSVAVFAGCGDSDDPLGGEQTSTSGDATNSIVIGSANFPESETIASIYAAALRANGFDVTTKLDIGSREAYMPALDDGSIDVIPDYTGNLLLYLDPNATASSSADVYAALTTTIGPDLILGKPAPGEDKDAVVVTKETADRWQLTSIADLAPHSADIKFGGPPEFAQRPAGLPGLAAKYGVNVAPENFVPIADGGGPATVDALASGDVTAANIFTTSPAITANNFVVLADPANNFPAQNVVAIARNAKYSPKLMAVLNAVAAQLTTDELIALNNQVSGDSKTEPDVAAQEWLVAQHLDKPLG